MRARFSAFFVALALFSLAPLAPAGARGGASYPLGYDVSFPQCRSHFPSPAAFAVVGVNGGKAGTWNRCMKRELAWAAGSSGANSVPGVSLYVNTGNPGPSSSQWPKSNGDPISGYPVADRYGKCAHRNTAACAWQYGWNMAEIDAMRRGIKLPLNYSWWLDVETDNSWQANRALNRAVLTGMTDYFQSLGVPVGLYSTSVQWSKIAGPVSASNPLLKLPEWVTGSSTQKDARSLCWQGHFLPGGNVVLSQWYTYSSVFDADVGCPGSGFRKMRNRY